VRELDRKNYYKNSRAQRRGRILRRCVQSIKVLLLLTGIGGTSLLFIMVHDALTQSPYFEARTITVEGNHRLSREVILKQAKIGLGDNILSVNVRRIRYRLLANPWIAAAEVERGLPDTIHIRVKERVPIAILDLNPPTRLASESVADSRFYLDEYGEIFKAVQASDEIKVPVVTGLRLSDIELGDYLRPRVFRAVMEALHLSRLHGTILPLHALHRIHADREMGLVLFAFEGGLAIKIGFGDYESKYNRLRDMTSYLNQEDQLLTIECIDLNDPDRVVVKPSRGVSLLGVGYRKEM